MIEGGCLCGAVRYQADGEPLFAVHCHCRDCQRSSGTGHVPVLGMRRESFSYTGNTSSYATVGMSKGKAIRHFCPVCGSLLFGLPESVPHMVSLYVGSLDDPSVFSPRIIVFASQRHEWDRLAAALPEFETLPPRR
jgi:hypothetical protein